MDIQSSIFDLTGRQTKCDFTWPLIADVVRLQPSPNPVFGPLKVYHGTPNKEWAFDILKNNRWKIGGSKSIYFAPKFSFAASYVEEDGAVIEVQICTGSHLHLLFDDEFIAYIGGGVPGFYYRIAGVTPKRIFIRKKKEDLCV